MCIWRIYIRPMRMFMIIVIPHYITLLYIRGIATPNIMLSYIYINVNSFNLFYLNSKSIISMTPLLLNPSLVTFPIKSMFIIGLLLKSSLRTLVANFLIYFIPLYSNIMFAFVIFISVNNNPIFLIATIGCDMSPPNSSLYCDNSSTK